MQGKGDGRDSCRPASWKMSKSDRAAWLLASTSNTRCPTAVAPSSAYAIQENIAASNIQTGLCIVSIAQVTHTVRLRHSGRPQQFNTASGTPRVYKSWLLHIAYIDKPCKQMTHLGSSGMPASNELGSTEVR